MMKDATTNLNINFYRNEICLKKIPTKIKITNPQYIKTYYPSIDIEINNIHKKCILPKGHVGKCKINLGLKYEDITPKFNNQKTHHSVWNYDMAKRCPVHITPKPIDLLKNIILHTTDENNIVLDCFAGSGSIAYACKETKRKCILIEKCDKYFKYIVKVLSNDK